MWFLACAGDVPTIEICAASWLLQKHVPGIRVRVVNVVDLMTLMFPDKHTHGNGRNVVQCLFTEKAPVVSPSTTIAGSSYPRFTGASMKAASMCTATWTAERQPRHLTWWFSINEPLPPCARRIEHAPSSPFCRPRMQSTSSTRIACATTTLFANTWRICPNKNWQWTKDFIDATARLSCQGAPAESDVHRQLAPSGKRSKAEAAYRHKEGMRQRLLLRLAKY